MKHAGKIILWIGAAAASMALLVSCETVNELERFDFRGTTIEADMRQPPEPTLDVHYDVHFDRHNFIDTVLSVGSNVLKASQAAQLLPIMSEALENVDVPSIVFKEASSSCADALGADLQSSPGQADYLLDLDIREYGLAADSPWAAVSMRLRISVSLVENATRTVVWHRRFNIERPASPQIFGLDSSVGNIVTAAILANISAEDLTIGFGRLAQDTARIIGNRMRDDLYEARY